MSEVPLLSTSHVLTCIGTCKTVFLATGSDTFPQKNSKEACEQSERERVVDSRLARIQLTIESEPALRNGSFDFPFSDGFISIFLVS